MFLAVFSFLHPIARESSVKWMAREISYKG